MTIESSAESAAAAAPAFNSWAAAVARAPRKTRTPAPDVAKVFIMVSGSREVEAHAEPTSIRPAGRLVLPWPWVPSGELRHGGVPPPSAQRVAGVALGQDGLGMAQGEVGQRGPRLDPAGLGQVDPFVGERDLELAVPREDQGDPH